MWLTWQGLSRDEKVPNLSFSKFWGSAEISAGPCHIANFGHFGFFQTRISKNSNYDISVVYEWIFLNPTYVVEVTWTFYMMQKFLPEISKGVRNFCQILKKIVKNALSKLVIFVQKFLSEGRNFCIKLFFKKILATYFSLR